MQRAEQKQINQGMLLGFVAVAIFSLSLPVTRQIVPYFDPIFIGLGRSLVAAIVSLPLLLLFKQPFPNPQQVKQLLLTAIGIIAGFPILTAFAMQTVPASHGSVVIGLLPLLTAIFAVVISKERPSLGFWITAMIGALLVVIYSLLQGGMELHIGDVYLVAASILGALVLHQYWFDGFRAIQSVQDKARVVANGYSLSKTLNAVLDALGCSLRASQKVVIHVVALLVKGATIPFKVRLVANHFLTR